LTLFSIRPKTNKKAQLCQQTFAESFYGVIVLVVIESR